MNKNILLTENMKIVSLNSNSTHKPYDDFLNWLQDDLDLVNKVILDNLKNSSKLVSELSSHIIGSGGKRIRPLLTLATAKLCDYSGSRHINLASVIEFIHTATLLHDDVVDNSRKRRGKDTANYLWGNKSSILVGDFLLSKAFKILTMDGSLKCIEIISKTSEKISFGEVKQLMSVRDFETSESEYMEIIDCKTAELFSAACQVSSEICEVNFEKKKSLSEFGKYLGLAFQIIDDTLDYFSDEKKSGKEVGDDFREGKMSLPLILSFKRSDRREKKLLKHIVNKQDSTDDELKWTIELMNKYGIKDDCMNKAKHFSLMSKDSLGTFPNSQQKEKIIAIIEFLITRKS